RRSRLVSRSYFSSWFGRFRSDRPHMRVNISGWKHLARIAPVNLNRLAGPDCVPLRLRDYTYKIPFDYRLDETRNLLRCTVVEAHHLSSGGRWPDDTAVKHAGNTDVGYILELSKDLGRKIDAGNGLSNDRVG